MDNRSYMYPLDPNDPLLPEKTSVVHALNESSKEIRNICSDKENWFLSLIAIIASVFIGGFAQAKNLIGVLLLLNGLIGLIIWRINLYRKGEIKLRKFFEKMENSRQFLGIPRIPI